MAHRLFAINDRPFTPEPGLDHLLSRFLPDEAGFCRRYLEWSSLAPGDLSAFKPHLIIALAAADRERATKMFHSLRDWHLAVPILAVLPSESDAEVLRVAGEVADDFIFWPPRKDELERRVTRLLGAGPLELDRVRDRLAQEMGLAQLVGQDPAFVEIISQIPQLGRSDAPVLLLGETGTGKELCARALHHLSPRGNYPFVPVDCGALPEHLAENELFGHARGAFTGAHADQKGLAAMAEGGTLFLDEIDSLSPPVQAKLLRFLEDRTYRALGADRFTRANVRVLAATNRDLEPCVRDKQFRQDLYFRLNVLQLRLPALRDRRGDIPLLARHFLQSLRRPAGGYSELAERPEPAKSFSAGALRMLLNYHWPGNVRELFNIVQRAAVLASGPQILPRQISIPALAGAPTAASTFRAERATAVAAFERFYVEEMLRKHRGNITRAAIEAHKDRRAFGRLVKKYALDRTAI
ncbi:MAG TPA: sigma-54 dependent transcriptional regulator [Terriglobia bacterium]